MASVKIKRQPVQVNYKYVTPIFNRDELHRTVSPLLTSYHTEMIKKYMSDIAQAIACDYIFDRTCAGQAKFNTYKTR